MDDSESFLDNYESPLDRRMREKKVLTEMLPKIEEQRNLALYLFELERRIDELEKEINKLKTQ
jgi:hypothetical protein